jgi:hypothetical protein
MAFFCIILLPTVLAQVYNAIVHINISNQPTMPVHTAMAANGMANKYLIIIMLQCFGG